MTCPCLSSLWAAYQYVSYGRQLIHTGRRCAVPLRASRLASLVRTLTDPLGIGRRGAIPSYPERLARESKDRALGCDADVVCRVSPVAPCWRSRG
ncbi:hypothetical protein BHM03_00044507 [Ensete ventricosum]|nr:hypothetical protein BHM03_00044507 [Ensete ventricosum]